MQQHENGKTAEKNGKNEKTERKSINGRSRRKVNGREEESAFQTMKDTIQTMKDTICGSSRNMGAANGNNQAKKLAARKRSANQRMNETTCGRSGNMSARKQKSAAEPAGELHECSIAIPSMAPRFRSSAKVCTSAARTTACLAEANTKAHLIGIR